MDCEGLIEIDYDWYFDVFMNIPHWDIFVTIKIKIINIAIISLKLGKYKTARLKSTSGNTMVVNVFNKRRIQYSCDFKVKSEIQLSFIGARITYIWIRREALGIEVSVISGYLLEFIIVDLFLRVLAGLVIFFFILSRFCVIDWEKPKTSSWL